VTELEDEHYTIEKKVPTYETRKVPYQITRSVPYEEEKLIKRTEYDTEKYSVPKTTSNIHFDTATYTTDRQVPRTIYEKEQYNFDVQVPFLTTDEVEVPTYELEEQTRYESRPRKVITQNTIRHKHSEPHADDGHHH
jgi:tryptophanase